MPRKITRCSKSLFLGLTLSAFLISPPIGNKAFAKDIPQTININTQVNRADIAGLPKDRKHVNSFSHQKHATTYLIGKAKYSSNPYKDGFTCAACHPGDNSRAEILAITPSKRLAAALNKNGGPKKLKNYFHNICRSCHKKLKKAGLASGPTNCKGCHGRK